MVIVDRLVIAPHGTIRHDTGSKIDCTGEEGARLPLERDFPPRSPHSPCGGGAVAVAAAAGGRHQGVQQRRPRPRARSPRQQSSPCAPARLRSTPQAGPTRTLRHGRRALPRARDAGDREGAPPTPGSPAAPPTQLPRQWSCRPLSVTRCHPLFRRRQRSWVDLTREV